MTKQEYEKAYDSGYQHGYAAAMDSEQETDDEIRKLIREHNLCDKPLKYLTDFERAVLGFMYKDLDKPLHRV